MKTKSFILLAVPLIVFQCIGRDFGQYLASNAKHGIAPEKREDLVLLAKEAAGQDRRVANALLAFEAVGKAQEDNSYDFSEAKNFAQAAILSSTNDWINIWARCALIVSGNLQRHANRTAIVTNTLALLQTVDVSVWETPDNPIYPLWKGSVQATTGKLREVLSRIILSNYCSLYRFDDAETFLTSCPDSPWKREFEKNLTLQKEGHARSLEEAKQIRLLQEKAMREKPQ